MEKPCYPNHKTIILTFILYSCLFLPLIFIFFRFSTSSPFSFLPSSFSRSFFPSSPFQVSFTFPFLLFLSLFSFLFPFASPFLPPLTSPHLPSCLGFLISWCLKSFLNPGISLVRVRKEIELEKIFFYLNSDSVDPSALEFLYFCIP